MCVWMFIKGLCPDFKCRICKQGADKFAKIEEAPATPAKNPYADTKTEKNL